VEESERDWDWDWGRGGRLRDLSHQIMDFFIQIFWYGDGRSKTQEQGAMPGDLGRSAAAMDIPIVPHCGTQTRR